ncbi:hypothetical protein [Deinococcus sp.]|uniref:hypothetical protein n=1 Tax=Deinococcus sp. TaxID=47478 RepID=UPI003C7C7EC6
MIDGFLNTLRKTGERVQRRGETVAQAARLRLDIFQLGREHDALYARLGRAYHGNASVSTLEEIRAEISRVDEEISAREKLLAELGAEPDDRGGTALSGSATAVAETRAADAQTAPNVWREKEEARMSDTDLEIGAPKTGPVTDATGRPDGQDADPTTTAGGDPHARLYSENRAGDGEPTHPNEAGQGDKLAPTSNTASMGNEAARDEMVRHRNHLKEGELATRDPDPLASKD